ncbi:2OG-Fe(II) oxygenase [Paucibacter sp. O1-1]|nr:2OG-Fe(II) oxygenase [Paucibacter sp. O1-1]MDA3829361.1 2OG-Fe(II) oxygenase [Paucibacter sp. O1-1]
MSIQQLTPDWQAWLRENVARGCSRDTMLPLLVQGGFAQAVAERALDELIAGAPALPAAQGQALRKRPAPELQANRIDCAGHSVRVAAVLDAPQIALFESLLSEAECAAMIALAETRLARSTVVDEQLGEARAHEHRTSAGAWFQRGETPLVATIEARLAALLRWPVDHGEGLQVLRYGPGGEYRAHHDFFNPAHAGSQRHLQQGGQRVGTCILYLGEVEAGGGTRFPQLGFEVRPSRGAALYFADVDARGVEDPVTLHAGVPVLAGVKYIATKWLRERPYV